MGLHKRHSVPDNQLGRVHPAFSLPLNAQRSMRTIAFGDLSATLSAHRWVFVTFDAVVQLPPPPHQSASLVLEVLGMPLLALAL